MEQAEAAGSGEEQQRVVRERAGRIEGPGTRPEAAELVNY